MRYRIWRRGVSLMGTMDNRSVYEVFQRHLPGIVDYAAADLGQGFTPLVRSRALGLALGLSQLYFKVEAANPTGSYKDRFAGLGMALAKSQGATACLATSSGNTGAALAAFAAALQMDLFIFVNERAPAGKLSQMRAYGARIFQVRGMGLTAESTQLVFRTLGTVAREQNKPLLISAFAQSPEPMLGIKTISYEIAQQLPDVRHVFCPAGGGGLYAAVAMGFADLASEKGANPKVHIVQPRLNDTIVTSLSSGHSEGRTVSTVTTISGLAVPFDLDGPLCIKLARACGGAGLLIEDEEAIDCQQMLMRSEGLLVEPAGAVSVAGLAHACREGLLRADEPVVCVLTGHGFKDPLSIEAAVADLPIGQISPGEIPKVLET
jgi:threonine synthase